ncbi:uncharacterized protein BJ212DRAFT_1300399 [Suillus subaureus]|uniref:DUF6533 domain-containing protein n=1 Tax=Suillus subaureus TaxID=48587 RepID=A0A9P7E9T7_9AGAM|nr:uncharacterized protein BJ212DRAFT_1300399 [Suillus subaureus]KAG1815254.1 hypothetical protein BJ212DRAFT_1300399 [Suillus subaureus]
MKELAVVENQATEKYLRIASISIALYDYIITLPAEWRFYRSQSSLFRLRLACILFILIRNYGVFSTGFTQETCKHYYMVAPVFKVMQTMISQVILGVRTFNIARRDRRIGITLVVLYFVSISFSWSGSPICSTGYVSSGPYFDLEFMLTSEPIAVVVSGNCTPGNSGKILSAWFYYTVSMLYDLAVLTISTVYLLRYNPLSNRLEQLVRVLIYDGIGYFVVLTGSNILNIVLYHTSNIQTQDCSQGTTRASIGFAVIWIMSQRILIHLRELSEAENRRLDNIVAARSPQNARDVVSAIRSPLSPKNHIDPEFGLRSFDGVRTDDMELDICTCVKPLVTLDHTDECGVSSSWDNPMEN